MNKEKFNNIIKIYLDNLNINNLELETRFGNIKKITRLDHDNVIKKLVSNKFTINEPNYLLRINSNFTDIKTGVTKISNIRSEIIGLNNIFDLNLIQLKRLLYI